RARSRDLVPGLMERDRSARDLLAKRVKSRQRRGHRAQRAEEDHPTPGGTKRSLRAEKAEDLDQHSRNEEGDRKVQKHDMPIRMDELAVHRSSLAAFTPGAEAKATERPSRAHPATRRRRLVFDRPRQAARRASMVWTPPAAARP